MTTASALVSQFPSAPWAVPSSNLSAGRYLLRFARTEADLDRILRLRYEVYRVELGQGMSQADSSEREQDDYDHRFHHLLIEERETGEAVATYRVQTSEMASRGMSGYYAERLFEVSGLPDTVRRRAVEVGRACLARPHRNGRVLNLLWRGLASYLAWNKKTILFGSCSLSSQDPGLGLSMHRHLEEMGAVHPVLRVEPRAELSCAAEHRLPETGMQHPPPKVPALFQATLTMGAKVLGPPAIDRELGTTDWLTLLDVEELDPFTYRAFFK